MLNRVPLASVLLISQGGVAWRDWDLLVKPNPLAPGRRRGTVRHTDFPVSVLWLLLSWGPHWAQRCGCRIPTQRPGFWPESD